MQDGELRFTKPERKRNRLVTTLLLPFVGMVWLVGWSLYWIGHLTEGKPKPQPKRMATEVTLVPASALEEETAEVPTQSIRF